MATKTLGTSATTSLNPAVKFLPGFGSGIATADMASMCNHIKDDLTNGNPRVPEAFTYNGLLIVPNRGVLKVLPGDWVGVDSQGWPILVSKNSIANAAWTHS